MDGLETWAESLGNTRGIPRTRAPSEHDRGIGGHCHCGLGRERGFSRTPVMCARGSPAQRRAPGEHDGGGGGGLAADAGGPRSNSCRSGWVPVAIGHQGTRKIKHPCASPHPFPTDRSVLQLPNAAGYALLERHMSSERTRCACSRTWLTRRRWLQLPGRAESMNAARHCHDKHSRTYVGSLF